jgi:hypothetical protein
VMVMVMDDEEEMQSIIIYREVPWMPRPRGN